MVKSKLYSLAKKAAKKVLTPFLPKSDEFYEYQKRVNSWCEGKYLKYYISESANPDQFDLSKEEEEIINRKWSKYIHYPLLYDAWKIEKGLTGKITPSLIPTYIWYGYVLQGMCGYMEGRIMSDKGRYGWYFKDVLRPFEPIRNVNGCFYDDGNRMITRERAISILNNYGKPFIIKPSVCSMGGEGVRKIVNMTRDEIARLLIEYGRDFVCQEIIHQSKSCSQFNDSSLNTFRVLTLLLNGRFSHLFTHIRVGAKGSLTDNVSQGGFFVNIDSEGRLSNRGLGFIGNILTFSAQGVPLTDIRIPQVKIVNEFARNLHERVPSMPIVAWDIALNDEDIPVLIEANMGNSTVFPQFLTNADMLGDRFDEIMEYATSFNVRKHDGPDMQMRFDSYKPHYY